MILIDRGDYCIIGFIDIMREISPKVVDVFDIKTGGSKKEDGYKKPEYIQVVTYSKALEDEGYTINKTGVWFCRRTNSHIKPPLNSQLPQRRTSDFTLTPNALCTYPFQNDTSCPQLYM